MLSYVKSMFSRKRQMKQVKEINPSISLKAIENAVSATYIFNYNDAPNYLKFNPYIKSGYRGYLSTKMCLQSIFWWTNETVNIWSHMIGWVFFATLTCYDLLSLNIQTSTADKLVFFFLMMCCQVTMILSTLYHVFSCRSEDDHKCFLVFDACAICHTFLAICLTAIYNFFWCHKEWQQFYIVSNILICLVVVMHQIPHFNMSPNIQQLIFLLWGIYGFIPAFFWSSFSDIISTKSQIVEWYPLYMVYNIIFFILMAFLQMPKILKQVNIKELIFVLWGIYVLIPTFHWAAMMGGLQNFTVQIFLPPWLMMYVLFGLAFLIYATKFPERFLAGRVDYIGASHQLWHILIVIAFYYWRNTGINYMELRALHGCEINHNKLYSGKEIS